VLETLPNVLLKILTGVTHGIQCKSGGG